MDRTKVMAVISLVLLLIALPILGACGEKEVVKEVIKEVPIEKVVVKEVVKEVLVEKVVEKEVVKEVPVEKVVTKVYKFGYSHGLPPNHYMALIQARWAELVEEASKALELEPIKLEFLEEALVA
ncbi:MAG: hypothetical protein COS88_01025 [Chloroflexi bacterium CG07_land_8_20_14_0_80_51_10]|nr:MAG: hypothetical protein COS88_01025 [Chloroflexi bacterium CG07_land_8_20_14_0_80_51_10]